MLRTGFAITTSKYLDYLSLLVREFIQRQILLHGRCRFDVGRASASTSAAIISGWSGPLTAIRNESFNLPFNGLGGRIARAAMTFYNRRLVALAKRRWETGYYGRWNAGWRVYDGFVPDARLRKQIWHGLRRWWKCELINLRLMLTARAAVPASEASATARTETVQA
jgi:hypothetical protein